MGRAWCTPHDCPPSQCFDLHHLPPPTPIDDRCGKCLHRHRHRPCHARVGNLECVCLNWSPPRARTEPTTEGPSDNTPPPLEAA